MGLNVQFLAVMGYFSSWQFQFWALMGLNVQFWAAMSSKCSVLGSNGLKMFRVLGNNGLKMFSSGQKCVKNVQFWAAMG